MPAKQSGNAFLLLLEDTPGSGTFSAIAHLTTNSVSRSNAVVDASNKTDGRARCNLQIGQIGADLSGEIVVSDDATYEKILDVHDNSLLQRIRVVDGKAGTPRVYEYDVHITELTETGEVNGLHTASVTMPSTGNFTRIQ